MRRILLVLFAIAALVAGACSSSGEDDTTPTDGGENGVVDGNGSDDADDVDDPAVLVRDAVDTTMAATSFTIDSELRLSVDTTALALDAQGPVDYEALIADVRLDVTSSGSGGGMSVRADGETLWIGADGAGVPSMPGGSTWVEGPAALLRDAESFGPEGLLGTVFALRAATDVEVVGEEDVDGVATTRFTTSFTYGEAVEAAGPDQEAFTESFSLRGFDHAVIEVEAWIGDDGVIRRLRFTLDESEPADLTGSYELALSDVDEPVDRPAAPDRAEVATGPEAEAWLEANLS